MPLEPPYRQIESLGQGQVRSGFVIEFTVGHEDFTAGLSRSIVKAA
jgi:hypothetical protein